MRGTETERQTEGLRRIDFAQESLRLVARIAGQVYRIAVDRLVEIAAAVGEFAAAVVEVGRVEEPLRTGTGDAELPEIGGRIAARTQQDGIGLLHVRLFERALPEGVAVRALVHARKQRRAAGGADRRRDEGVAEADPFAGQRVDVRRADDRVDVSHGVPPLVVGQNEDCLLYTSPSPRDTR